MKLDVGCGNYPEGDVNCDLYITDRGHRGTNGTQLPLKRIPNFVLCDAHHLPFKTEGFEQVRSHGVIEHVDEPFLHLRELVRVCNGTVQVQCPWRYSDKLHHKNKYNKWFLNKAWFTEAISKLGCYGSVAYSMPPWLMLFGLVYLKVTIRKW